MNIYYLCPDENAPCGGIMKIYQHVDILNKNGFSAFVLHHQSGFRCNWFSNQTQLAYWRMPFYRRILRKIPYLKRGASKKIYFKGKQNARDLNESDYLVVPEIYTANIGNISPGIKKVIFNQNVYYTFDQIPIERKTTQFPYHCSDVVGIITISDDNEAYLRHVFPEKRIFRIRHLSRRTDLFCYQAEKKKQICFMSRKHFQEARQVINILKLRGVLNDFEIVEIDHKSLEETAEIMQRSLVFLSFGYPEGNPLPPSEAMLCGCIVIGYHGGGGKEYMRPEFSYPVEATDVIGFSKTVERVIAEWRKDPGIFVRKTLAAASFIRENYSPEQESAELVQIWNTITQ
jgi:hypothetical protein